MMSATSAAFNPHSLEGHYGVDMACYLVHQYQPASVCISTDDAELAIAAARRLGWVREPLQTTSPQVAQAISERLGLDVQRSMPGQPPELLLLLFPSAPEALPEAPRLVVLAHNACSYKSLLYPGTVRGHVFGLLRALRPYRIERRVGLFGPRFVIAWGIAQVAGVRYAAAHFRSGQQATDNIYMYSRLWWLGYLVVVAGRRKT